MKRLIDLTLADINTFLATNKDLAYLCLEKQYYNKSGKLVTLYNSQSECTADIFNILTTSLKSQINNNDLYYSLTEENVINILKIIMAKKIVVAELFYKIFTYDWKNSDGNIFTIQTASKDAFNNKFTYIFIDRYNRSFAIEISLSADARLPYYDITNDNFKADLKEAISDIRAHISILFQKINGSVLRKTVCLRIFLDEIKPNMEDIMENQIETLLS